jgi:hypothetical protein
MPAGVPAGARGSFSGRFWPYGKGWSSARFTLSTRRLTSPALNAHIHTGAPGRNGPVLVTLCAHGRCNLSGSSFRVYDEGTIEGMINTMRLLGAYVDVHTKQNPQGELRGQIEIRKRR